MMLKRPSTDCRPCVLIALSTCIKGTWQLLATIDIMKNCPYNGVTLEGLLSSVPMSVVHGLSSFQCHTATRYLPRRVSMSYKH
eukprot:scaffold216692_cov18-Tisochrysis_lutea.AAC.1